MAIPRAVPSSQPSGAARRVGIAREPLSEAEPKRALARAKFVLHIKCIRKESHVPAEADTSHVATQYFPRRIPRYTLWRSTAQREAGYQFARKINAPLLGEAG